CALVEFPYPSDSRNKSLCHIFLFPSDKKFAKTSCCRNPIATKIAPRWGAVGEFGMPGESVKKSHCHLFLLPSDKKLAKTSCCRNPIATKIAPRSGAV